MKAVVLVGGEGTRLRPLTETTPKPLVNLMDRPSLDHVLDHLARHGIREAILSSSFLEKTFRSFLQARSGPPAITWITEESPLGTAGAIVNALEHLEGETFLVLNGDILTDLDLSALVEFHRERKAVATIALTPVEDARPFGLVMTEADARVKEFREKPAEPIPGNINAGTYVLEPEALAGWTRGETISIERQVFPQIVSTGRPMYGFLSDAYWLDLGTPEKYLQAHRDFLEGKIGDGSYEAPYVAPGAILAPGARLGRWVVVGVGATVGADASVEDSVLLPAAAVERGAVVRDSIVGSGAAIGAGAEIVGCVLGEGARVPGGSSLEGARVSASQGP